MSSKKILTVDQHVTKNRIEDRVTTISTGVFNQGYHGNLEENTFRPGEGRKQIATCIIAMLRDDSLPIFGDGEQSSDFVHIDDVVEAFMRAPRNSAIEQVIDIGTGVSMPVKEVFKVIIELTGSKSKIEHRSIRTGEVKVHTKADLADARKYLDWEPHIDLREGLRRTIPYYAKCFGVQSPT